MKSPTFTLILAFIISSCVVLLAWTYRLPIAKAISGEASAVNTVAAAQYNSYGTEMVIMADSSGHYVLDAEVDQENIRFMIDTGASITVLSYDDAKKLGYEPRRMKPDVQVNTGGGMVEMVRVNLSGIEAGQIRVSNVEALIAPDNGMRQSVLGMNFLRSLRSYSVESGKMTLVP